MAIAIKNTLLLVLIILIGHFMLKNLLFDKKILHNTVQDINKDEPKTTAKKHLDVIGNISTDTDIIKIVEQAPIGNDTTSIISSPSGIPSSEHLQSMHGGLDKAKEELLKFIDDDDDVMEKYFDNKTTTNSIIPTDNCKPKQNDNMFPLSTTCDPNIQNMSKGDKVIKSNCDLLQDKKQLLILNEYENENSMNGGSLFGGLNAFDAFDTTYSQL
jgi:hypothetical protein